MTTALDPSASFARWVAALLRTRDRAVLEAAFSPDARIERHDALARGAEPPEPAEVFVGLDAIERWMHRLLRAVHFWTVGAPVEVAGGWMIEYGLAVDDFTGGGIWIARFAGDGRIAYLSHRPFPLPEQYRSEAPPAGPAHPHAHPHS